MVTTILTNILSNVLSIPVIVLLGAIMLIIMKRTQLGRIIVWWWFSDKKLRAMPRTVCSWNRLITTAIDLVSNNLGTPRTFQRSPIGMPLATCSVDFYQKVMYMTWLLAQPGTHTLLAKIKTVHQTSNGDVYYDSDNESEFNKWTKNLLASYENDFDQIAIMSYNDFMWVFNDTLRKH